MATPVHVYNARSPRELLRSASWVLGFSSVLALFTFRLAPQHRFVEHWTLALTVGACYWLASVALTYVPLAWKPRADEFWASSRRGRRWLLLVVVAKLLACVLGTWLGSLLSGIDLWSGSREARMGLVLALLTGVVGTQLMMAKSRARALQVQLAETERDAARAHLRLLQAQLEPHMLFNTLANLRALVRLDADRAEQMIDHLNRFLRASLSASQRDEHALADELARLQDYLALMQVRMGPRLAVVVDVPEALRTLPVPVLILQPLVENAIRHGLEPQVQGGTIWLIARRVGLADGGAQLQLSVCDDGPGLPEAEPQPADPAAGRLHAGGLGLTHVRERLTRLHGPAAHLHLGPRGPLQADAQVPGCPPLAPTGTCARVDLPLPPDVPVETPSCPLR
ncbi:hypothetical protein CCO03_01920 [Comamonas serinivorans]|uniref:Histidine kinase/HSP90-like ATPase domain-containing protein n=1 Tax=Comamonas serinivorans TaxID=1082851 RepID=A0A1Y0EJ40_9BURK|nr:histidine kinase [Comamonas serinivorans]ARU03607.1 hypothetical protein CCO03_01920 [Comamonas serinivorans]